MSEEILKTAEAFWVAPLLGHQVGVAGGLAHVPASLRNALSQHLCFEAGFELLTGAEVRRLVAALSAAGVEALLLKGAALAYLHYPAPHLRPRLDTDLLIRTDDRPAVAALLTALGYERSTSLVEDVAHQEQYVRALRGGLLHAVDVHWKIANPRAFADLFAFDELRSTSVPVPALGDGARAPGAVHMLLLLAVHRIAHHERDMDLLCMYDLHRIALALDERGWREALAMADDRRLAPILGEALDSAFGVCPTPVPSFVAEWVERARHEPVAPRFIEFAGFDRRVADVIASDVRLANGWRERLRILRQHAFPPPAYITERYGVRRSWTLPYFYARRLAFGIPRILRRDLYR